jgi:hypothetical protein
MTEQRPDELQGGAEREPLAVPRAMKLVVAALAVGAVASLASRVDGGTEQALDPSPSPSPSSTSSAPFVQLPVPDEVDVQPLSQPGPLGIQDVCARTDHRKRLTVIIDVSNGSLDRITILDVTAALPLPGLVLTGVQLPAKPCGGEAAGSRALLMRPRGTVSAALHFRLPPECPAPYPVQAVVSYLGAGEQPRSQRLHLLNDLGSLEFDSC